MAVIGRNQVDQGGAAAEKVRQAVGAFLRRANNKRSQSASRPPNSGRGKSPKWVSHAIVGVEIGLVILIGLLCGRIMINLFSPLPAAENPPPPPKAMAAAIAAPSDPFRAVAMQEIAASGPAGPAAAETTLDLALHGAWVEEDGRSSAIIRTPDNEQKIFFVGDAICCGARLEEVYPEEVIISRGGVRESLRLVNKEGRPRAAARPAGGSSARQSDQRAAPSDVGEGVSDIAEIVRFSPKPAPNGGFLVQIFPSSDEGAFEALGFRSGDIVLSINNRPAPSDLAGLNKLLEMVKGAKEASIVVERAGTNVPLKVVVGDASTAPSQ